MPWGFSYTESSYSACYAQVIIGCYYDFSKASGAVEIMDTCMNAELKYLHVDFDLALERNGRFELNFLAAYSRHKTHSFRPETRQR